MLILVNTLIAEDSLKCLAGVLRSLCYVPSLTVLSVWVIKRTNVTTSGVGCKVKSLSKHPEPSIWPGNIVCGERNVVKQGTPEKQCSLIWHMILQTMSFV